MRRAVPHADIPLLESAADCSINPYQYSFLSDGIMSTESGA